MNNYNNNKKLHKVTRVKIGKKIERVTLKSYY